MKRKAILDAPGYYILDTGVVISEKSGSPRPLIPWPNNMGYLLVKLCVNGQPRKRFVHKLVIEAFVGPRLNTKDEVRHIDGNHTNNQSNNLIWGTHKQNMEDMVRHGHQAARLHPDRVARGERHGSKTKPHRVARGEAAGTSRLTNADVRAIRARVGRGEKRYKIAKEYGLRWHTINNVVTRKTWKHIS